LCHIIFTMANKADNLSLIGKRIKDIRKVQKLSLKELADSSGVSTGLISKIENFRTIPSLPVLYQIAQALNTSMADIVSLVILEQPSSFILIKAADREVEEREDSMGLIYESIISTAINEATLKVNLIKAMPGTNRPHISTEAIELLFLISGKLEYMLNQDVIHLEEGDSLFFDGRIPHAVINNTSTTAVMLKCYIFNAIES